ncbi:MAG: M56 family metallopeptidase [Ruminococcus sp.]|nr:M56 family metallopeptidase [Ruminococcus sp.]
MTDVFKQILQFSIQAGLIVLALIVLRLILRKAPRSLICSLWALVAVRLVFPFHIESIFSLAPMTDTLTITSDVTTHGFTQQSADPRNVTIITAPVSGEPIFAQSTPMSFYQIAAYVWAAGVLIMLIYALISYLRLYRLTKEKVKADDHWLCDKISSPFILGLFRPRIILPFTVDEADKPYILAHERAHLKRRDHLWKPLGFLLLSVYWFNPLLWVAYILLCRDIEMACDEKVLKELGFESKKPYATALVNAAAPRRMVAACPLAFGETGVKARVKNVLNYKKPAFWVIVTVIVLSVVIAVCFLTNPVSKSNSVTATPDNANSPVSASYIWSSFDESGSRQDGYAFVNLRVSNYSDQYITLDMGKVRVYKDGRLLTPSYTDDTQCYDFYEVGTSNTTMVSLYPYLAELDSRSTFRLEMDYYSFEETDATDIDGEYPPNVGKEPLGAIALNFRFLSKEERGDVPDFIYDILYHDIDDDGVEEMLVLFPGPTSGIYSLSVGAYDKDTHKEKYKPESMSFLGSSYPANNCLSVIKGGQAVIIAYEQDFNVPESDPREVIYAIKTDGEKLYFEKTDTDA